MKIYSVKKTEKNREIGNTQYFANLHLVAAYIFCKIDNERRFLENVGSNKLQSYIDLLNRLEYNFNELNDGIDFYYQREPDLIGEFMGNPQEDTVYKYTVIEIDVKDA